MSRSFKLNFIVHSPTPEYVSHIGGIAVAHSLAHELSMQGENVYLYANSTNPTYDRVTCIPWGTDLDYDPQNTVVIIIAGSGEHTFEHHIPHNLQNGPNVVRWLVHNQEKLYPTDNKLYMHTRLWDTLEGQTVDGDLCIFDLDLDLFRNRNQPRQGSCYLVKGNLDDEPHRATHRQEDYNIESVLYNIPNLQRREYLADLFNRMEYFITYTPITLTSVLAALCGCKSIIVPKSTFNPARWREVPLNKYGIAMGLDDLPRAIATMDQVEPNINNFKNNTMPLQLSKFIDDCYEWLIQKYNIKF
jgi:hypothetical protein